jgi:IclR family acetate operon transcriptional repressor
MHQGTKSLSTALKILELFASSRREWRVTELASKIGLHKSQVSRVLRTFESHGFMRKKEGQYRLGQAFSVYASLAKPDRELVEAARPIMEGLSKQIQGNVVLNILEGGETITIDRVESQHFLRLSYPVGLRLPLNASASGKVFLAYMSPGERSRLYEAGSFQKFTYRSKTELTVLEGDLLGILRRSFALSDEEHLLGTRGVAAPIFGPSGNLEAALGVGLPKVLLPDKRIETVSASVRKAAEEISLLLGYQRIANNGKGHLKFIRRTKSNGRHKRR